MAASRSCSPTRMSKWIRCANSEKEEACFKNSLPSSHAQYPSPSCPPPLGQELTALCSPAPFFLTATLFPVVFSSLLCDNNAPDGDLLIWRVFVPSWTSDLLLGKHIWCWGIRLLSGNFSFHTAKFLMLKHKFSSFVLSHLKNSQSPSTVQSFIYWNSIMNSPSAFTYFQAWIITVLLTSPTVLISQAFNHIGSWCSFKPLPSSPAPPPGRSAEIWALGSNEFVASLGVMALYADVTPGWCQRCIRPQGRVGGYSPAYSLRMTPALWNWILGKWCVHQANAK